MRNWYLVWLSLALTLGVFGCAQPASDTVSTDEGPVAEAGEAVAPAEDGASEPAVAPTEEAATEPAAEPAAAPTANAATGLENTTWKVGEFTVVFKDSKTLLASGGPLATLAPDGIEGTYSVDNGTIEVTVVANTLRGTWDGTTLVIDGKTGERIS